MHMPRLEGNREYSDFAALRQKGFPIETTTMEDVEAFFKPHGDILCVRLHRNPATKAFQVAP